MKPGDFLTAPDVLRDLQRKDEVTLRWYFSECFDIENPYYIEKHHKMVTWMRSPDCYGKSTSTATFIVVCFMSTKSFDRNQKPGQIRAKIIGCYEKMEEAMAAYKQLKKEYKNA
jgi:hypothetical protein